MRFYSSYILILLVGALFSGSIILSNQSIVFAASNATVSATAKISVCGNNVKETGEQCDVNDFGGRSCNYLGFDGGSLICSPACGYNTSSCTTTAEQTATPLFSANIGGDYTIVDGNNSAKIILPVNFYSADIRLQMFAFDKASVQSSEPPPSGKVFVGKVYKFLVIDPNGNIVPTISKPATITITYTSLDMNNLDSNMFMPYHRGSSGGWSPISSYTVNTANKTITFNTSSFGSFAIFGLAHVSPPPPSGGGGGGGGGGGTMTMITPQVATVTLSGRAYPGSVVTVLKDAIVVATTRAGEGAAFSITVGDLSAGTYLFSVYATDINGNRSSIVTVPVSVTAGVHENASGIFLAPTVAVNKSEVKQGDTIRVFGQTVPKNTVTISVHSKNGLFFQTPSDKSGVYSYSFLTAPLGMGGHTVNVAASGGGEVSRTSASVAFAVGTQNVATVAHFAHTFLLGDVNRDGFVNIIDFSIEAFWYKKPNPPARYDLNGDGAVNIVDFSIMASHWTG